MELIFAFMADAQLLLVAIALYKWCPMRQWRRKLLSCIFLICICASTVHNSFVYFDLINEGTPAFVSVASIIVFMVLFSIKLMTKWDNLPNDKIEPGYIYEIIGKPRNDLQFLAFLLSGGSGGTWYVTDGINCWYFSRSTGVQEKEPLDLQSLIGRKVVKVCESSPSIIEKLNSGNGRKWSILNNCLTAFRI